MPDFENDEQRGEFPDPEDESAEMVLAGFRKNEDMKNDVYGSAQLGKILEYEKAPNGEYTGRVRVELVSTPGQRQHVLIPVPSGLDFWVGGMPPPGSLGLVVWLPMGIPAIAAFYPLNFRNLIATRSLVNLIPGELLLQASSGVTRDEQQREGRALFDRHGRITLETRTGVRIILGDPGLANGLVEADSDDSITGEQVALQIAVGDTVINVTEDGSVSIDAEKIRLGGEGRKLATEDFVNDIYNSHTHTQGTYVVPGAGAVAGISGAPIQSGTDSHLTEKTKAE